MEGRKGADQGAREHAQRKREERCRGKTIMQEVAAGRCEEEELSAGDEELEGF